jgi:hypothetical protein
MDEMVLRGMAKWPDVAAVYGWLSLDRRGNWLIKDEIISNPTIAAYIGRNYERDSDGRWFFQNGPQRVFVSLDYTPLVYRILGDRDALAIEAHTGTAATSLSGAWIDESGGVLLDTELGIGVVHDHDLERLVPAFIDAHGKPLEEERFDELMQALQQNKPAPLWLAIGRSNVKVEPVCSSDVPRRFGFNADPSAQNALECT